MIPAGKILDVLVEECGWKPSDSDREMFAYYYDKADSEPLEYRFMGALGFGGKLRMRGERLSVDCYPEDATPVRLAMIERANQRLAELIEARP